MGAAFLAAVGAAASAVSGAFSGITAAFGAGGALASGTLLGGLARTAIGIGLSLLARKLLAPKPKPSQNKTEVRQAIPPRSFSYGRLRVSGPLAFRQAVDNNLYKIVLISSREIDGIEQLYLHDRPVEVDGSDQVVTAPYVIAGTSRSRLTTHLGTDDQTADAMMMAAWPDDWTSDHRLRGIAYIAAEFEATLNAENFSKVYPQGEPEVSALIRASKVYDPRLDDTVDGGVGAHRDDDPDTWEWSDNAALCVLDYLTHSDGYARPIAKIDLPSFMAMADLCDEAVPLLAGGTEARYRVATTVYLTEQRKEVLGRLLEACDGRIYRTVAGLYGIRGGQWVAPTVTLDADEGHILAIEFAEPDGIQRYNKIVIQFLSPPHNYVEQECDPWLDQDDIDANGEKSEQLDLTQVPSYTQARRLAKIQFARDNPDWLVTAQTNFAGLDCISEETATLDFAEMLIDGPFWLDAGPQLAEDFTGAQLQLRSADPASYDWTTAEEGTAPTVPEDITEGADIWLAAPGEYWEVAPEDPEVTPAQNWDVR